MSGAGKVVPVDIVVPVYNAADDLDCCVRSVLAHTPQLRDGSARLILIDDASPDPAIARYFESLAARSLASVELLRNASNLGFTGTANRGMALSQSDVVLLNSDTQVTAGWLTALSRCAASSPHVGTITPWSNNAEICSYPSLCVDTPWNAEDDPEPVREALAFAAVPTYPCLPTGVGFCLYIRREVIDSIGVFDMAFGKGYGEENDFCMRAWRAGYWNLLADDAFVLHLGGRSFTQERKALSERNTALLNARHPYYEQMVADFIARDPLKPLRDAAQSLQRVAEGSRGVLHIIHLHGGGTELHARSLIGASSRQYRHYLARVSGAHWRVEEQVEDGSVRTFDFVRDDTEAWPDFVGGLASTFGIALIHVHNLSMCREGIIEALAALPLPFGYTVHDLDFACPSITMLARDGLYCGGETREHACNACLGAQPAYRSIDIGAWRARHAAFVGKAAFLIAPSKWAAATFERFFGRAPEVIPHSLPTRHVRSVMPAGQRLAPPAGPAVAVLMPDDDCETVAIVGAIGPDKGARRIERLAALAAARNAKLRFVVVGHTDVHPAAWQSEDGYLTVHGRYDPADLARLLSHYGASFVLYPSAGPESFSFTLSEVWSAGRPALVPPIGALAERVAETGAGWVMSEAEWRDEAQVLDRLLALCSAAARPDLREAARRAQGALLSSPSAMAARTLAVYDAVPFGARAALPARFPPARVRDALGYRLWWTPEWHDVAKAYRLGPGGDGGHRDSPERFDKHGDARSPNERAGAGTAVGRSRVTPWIRHSSIGRALRHARLTGVIKLIRTRTRSG